VPAQLAGRSFKPLARAGGSLLVTHKGATGPAPFDVSGPCGRAMLEGSVELRADFWSLTLPDGPWGPYLGLPKAPGASLPSRDVPRPPTREAFEAQARPLLAHRERGLSHALSERIPRSLLQGLLRGADLDSTQPVKQLGDSARTRLWLALTQADLQLAACEGYAKAEVTSGGVPLGELSPATLESRLCEHLFCCGEVINATGRLGGFNFQWAWSSGFAAGRGAAATL
jgi:predicted flavoprotein YhiN